MDELKFQINKTETDNFNVIVAVPFINGNSLIDRIKKIELKYDKTIAGAYDGIRPDLLLHELTNGSIQDKIKSKILECECGSDGCWTLLMSVTEKDKFVSWGNFEQIHRDNWDYSEMGEFVFEKSAYQKALEELKISTPNKV